MTDKIMINTKVLKSLKPCEDRYQNWLKYYKNWKGDFEEFLDLKDISHTDKIWISVKILEKKQMLQCTHDFAFSVLYIFEKKYPEDKNIRYLLEALQKYITEDLPIDENIINMAKKIRDSVPAYAAPTYVVASAYAAADVYYMYAAAAAADATYVASGASGANAARKKEQEKQIQIIKNVYNGIKNQ